MAERDGGFEGSIGPTRFKAWGDQAPVMVAVIFIILVMGSAIYAGQLRSEKQHEALTDAFEAYIWTQLPAEYRERMAPPKWVRERLNERKTR